MNGVSLVSAAYDSISSSKRVASNLAANESRVLAREAALKMAAPDGASSTVYKYEIGPDGRRYISGAEVTISRKSQGGASASGKNGEADAEAIAKLERTEREVVAHENAHKAAAGRFGSAPHYTYTTGPDGKRYISGGDVRVHTPATDDPEEALRNARQVMRAALAPGDPSGADIAAAASAAATAAEASARITRSASGASPKEALESYARTVSPKGLWTSINGFENAYQS
jgi:hypothetical protein